MSLLTVFEIITLSGVGLSLLSIALFEVGDAMIDRQRKSTHQRYLRRTDRSPANLIVNASIAAANSPSVELPKAA
jgi:hypothetical protein